MEASGRIWTDEEWRKLRRSDGQPDGPMRVMTESDLAEQNAAIRTAREHRNRVAANTARRTQAQEGAA